MADDQNTIRALLDEQRTFVPSNDFRAKALLSDRSFHDDAARDAEAFWASRASELVTWSTPWTTVCEWDLPYSKWFVGGQLNVSENCLDRHVAAGRGSKVAFHWEG